MADAIFQTSITARNGEAYAGQLATGADYEGTHRIARGMVKNGYGVFRVPGRGARAQFPLQAGEIFHQPTPGVAVDVDAITVNGTSATGVSTLADGVVGVGDMQPPRNLTVTFNSSTDWDATNGTIRYINDAGQLVSETVAIATSTSVTTAGKAVRFVDFTKPAQTGAGGAYTIGITAMASLVLADFVGVAIRQNFKTMVRGDGLYGYPGVSSTLLEANYIDGESVPVCEEGSIWVYSEEALTEGDPIYVRVASGAGGTILGAFRNDADSAASVVIPGARCKKSTAAAGPAWVKFPKGW